MFAQPAKYLLTIRCFFKDASVGASKKLASVMWYLSRGPVLILARKYIAQKVVRCQRKSSEWENKSVNRRLGMTLCGD